ncbi:hypothetical protein OQA88_13498 [Cercophora sp. LCS_1]
MAWNPWLCTSCRNITFFPMKSMTMERWRSYFPFLDESPQFEEEFKARYEKFIDLVPNDRIYEAILCPSRQALHDNAVDEDCQFCWLLGYIVQTECYWSTPKTPGTDSRAGITAWPPVEWPDDDIDDHRRSSPVVWLELSLKPGSTKPLSSISELEDATVTVKFGQVLGNPRFLLRNIQQEDSGWDQELEDIRESDDYTGSAQNVVLAKRWIEACQEHPGCQDRSNTATNGEMPTRLLDLSAPGLGEDLVLCEIRHNVEYATLSHRWGTAALTTTTTSDLQSRSRRIYIESLPKTFREAVAFTRNMGVRYLWIDSLCIIQDSPDDKDREIPKMASIYSNAVFNIAASAADDSSPGLFVQRSAQLYQPTELPLNIQLADGTKQSCYATFSRLLIGRSEQKLRSALDDRGWIFQERALSKRAFLFEKHMLIYECRSMIASENLPKGAPRGSGENNAGSNDKWLSLLPQSTSRALSLLGDLLSKAERAKEANDPSLPALTHTLLHNWYRATPGYLLRAFTHETDRLPAISSLASQHAPRKMLVEVLDAWTTPTDANKPFGDVKEGGIKIKGWMKKMAAWSAGTPTGNREEDWGAARIFELDANWRTGGLYMRGGEGRAFMDDVKRFVGGVEERKEVWVVPLMVYEPERNEGWQGTWEDGERGTKKICALVVEEREDGKFERVGFMWRLLLGEAEEWEGEDEEEGTWFDKGKVEREIVIV